MMSFPRGSTSGHCATYCHCYLLPLLLVFTAILAAAAAIYCVFYLRTATYYSFYLLPLLFADSCTYYRCYLLPLVLVAARTYCR